MISRRRFLAAAAASVAVPGVAAAQGINFTGIGQALLSAEKNRTGPVDHYLIGRQAAAELAAQAPLLPADHPLCDYVRKVVHTLALASNAPYVYQGPVVGILDTNQINAYAMPGGFILLTTELLKFLKSEDELAAMMGHELGHIELQHALYEQKNAEAKKMFDQASNGRFAQSLNAMMPMIKTGYSIEIEAEADARATALCAAAGYDPRALVTVLERFKARTNSYGGAQYPLKRAEMVAKASANLKVPSDDAIAARTARYQQALTAPLQPPAPPPAKPESAAPTRKKK
ncbi:MAG TPA: M48 family metallopeptidase [Magnetospirillum sp.]|nr:M48 family metallopeptidase [Magnetospirillum sp.]